MKSTLCFRAHYSFLLAVCVLPLRGPALILLCAFVKFFVISPRRLLVHF